jgi:hypothetical protein
MSKAAGIKGGIRPQNLPKRPLAFCLVKANLPGHVAQSWPWRLQLLDTGGALTAVLGTGGAALARAQYALTVKPALGSSGRVYDRAPADTLASRTRGMSSTCPS